jgi:hypothetical protein
VTSETDPLARGRNFLVFCEEVIGVKLNRGQRRWIKHNVTPDGRWKVKGSIWVAANQVGKSLLIAIVILWATFYKIGLNEQGQKWLETPYRWFHVSPTQQQAYIPLKDIQLLVKGAHPAQDIGQKQYGLKFSFPTPVVVFEKIENYDGFSTLTGAEAQFRTTDDKAKALQGRRANGISFDEAAFEDHLRSVVNETLLMRLVSTNGPLLIVSTPNGLNDYYEMVEQIRTTGRHPSLDDQFAWVTADGWALVWATVSDNIGYGLTAEAVERMERDLDPATKEQQLRGAFLEPLEAFFVPTGEIIKAWRPGLPLEVPAIPDNRYVIFWDPSAESDPTACYVLDCTTKPWKVVREVWERKPSGITRLVTQMFGLHQQYGVASGAYAITSFDSTGMGGSIIRQMLVGLRPLRPLNFAGSSKVKLDILTNLRAALVRGDLVIPEQMAGLKREVLNYRLKDDKLQQDRVMALAGAAWIASKTMGGVSKAAFDPGVRVAAPIWR